MNKSGGFIKGFFIGSLVTGLILIVLAVLIFVLFLFLECPFLFFCDVTRSIDAEKGWQSTGVWVKPGDRVEITILDGRWTHWQGTQPYNVGAGGGYICGKAMKSEDCVEPLPEFSSGALIGRVNDEVFAIGTGVIWKSTESGNLELRINDGDVGLYDNDGKLKVKIHLNNLKQ